MGSSRRGIEDKVISREAAVDGKDDPGTRRSRGKIL